MIPNDLHNNTALKREKRGKEKSGGKYAVVLLLLKKKKKNFTVLYNDLIGNCSTKHLLPTFSDPGDGGLIPTAFATYTMTTTYLY